jgi:hypothetical protein
MYGFPLLNTSKSMRLQLRATSKSSPPSPLLTYPHSSSPTALHSTIQRTPRGFILWLQPARPKWAPTMVSFLGCRYNSEYNSEFAVPPPRLIFSFRDHSRCPLSAVNRGRLSSHPLLFQFYVWFSFFTSRYVENVPPKISSKLRRRMTGYWEPMKRRIANW